MKILSLFVLLFSATASAQALDGTYSCQIQFQEAGKTRSANVALQFFADSLKVLNAAESFPGEMRISREKEMDQSSYGEDGFYEVSWPNTWHFGSDLSVRVTDEAQDGQLTVKMIFDDNDGWELTLDSVGCLKQ